MFLTRPPGTLFRGCRTDSGALPALLRGQPAVGAGP